MYFFELIEKIIYLVVKELMFFLFCLFIFIVIENGIIKNGNS